MKSASIGKYLPLGGFVVVVLAFMACSPAYSADEKRPPNVLLIMADDLG